MRPLTLATRLCAITLLSLVAESTQALMQTKGVGGVDSWGQSFFTVPLRLPPGTQGVLPTLSLSYSSRTQDRPFGVGWSLSGLSSITRCPAILATEGWVGAVRFDSNDRFCLDGQKLVVTGTGAYGADGTEYRTESETFTRVISQGTSGSGPTSFRVWTKSGLIMEYGTTPDSRFPASPNPSVREWALSRVTDRSGNYYAIGYGIVPSNNEAVPLHIDYTGNTNAGVAPYASISFSYETRPDPESYSVGTASVGRTLRATAIQTFVDNALVTQYQLTYDTGPSSARSRLLSVAECAPGGSCLGAISLSVQAGGGGITQPGATTVNLGYVGWPGSSSVVAVKKGDFNGDGIDDVLVIDNLSQARVCYGPGFSSATCGPFFSATATQVQVLDYNGDGISDLAILAGGQLRFCPGPSPAGDQPTCSAIANQTFYGHEMVAGDFNGDGKDEVFLWNTQNPNDQYGMYCDDIPSNLAGRSCYSRAKNGTGFRTFVGDFDGDGMADLLLIGSNDYWVCTGYSSFVGRNGLAACSHVTTAFDFSTISVQIGDFNGDSVSDILLVTPSDVQFCPGPAAITTNTCSHVPGTGGANANVVTGDFDGDGASDILFARSEGAYFSSGRIFLRYGPWNYNTSANLSGSPLIAGNFLGRGAKDIIAGGANLYLLSGATQMPDMLATAANSAFGNATSFSYLPLTDANVYTKGTGSTWPLQDVKRPWYVTSQMSVPTGVWNARKTFSYRYEKAHVSLEGRGGSMAPFNRNFIGFEITHQADNTNGRETVSSWLLSFPHNGRVQETTTYVNGQIAAKRTRQLDSVLTFENRPLSVLRNEWVTSFGLDGDWTNTRIDYGYDGFGNQAGISTYNNSYGTQYYDTREIVSFTFTNDAANWLIGAPATKDVSYNIPSTRQYLQQERYTTVPGTLLVQQKVKEPFVPQLQVTTNYTRNAFGEVTAESVTGNGMPTRTTTYDYDARGRFVVRRTNALNQATMFSNDSRFGDLTRQTDPNNVAMSWTYDDFGRRASETRPDGTQKIWQYTNCSGCRGYADNPNIAYYAFVQESGAPNRYEYFDEIDRHIMSTRPTFDGANWIDENNIWYDSDGKLARKYLSYGRADATHPYALTSYDSFGRVSTETAPNGGVTSYSYSAAANAGPITTTVTNARGYATRFVRDVWNQLLQVNDALNGTTSYSYDSLGKLSQATDAQGNVTTFGHNQYGWLTSKSDPDLGAWTYAYDALGEKTSQTDAKGQLTSYGYDLLGRKRSQSEPSQIGTWTYDTATNGIGKLATHSTNAGVQVVNNYDTAGRVTARATVVDGNFLSVGYGYDGLGRLASITYPNGFAISYVYNATNYLAQITNASTGSMIWKIVTADAYGPIDTDLGNGTGYTVSYDPYLRRPRTSVVTRDADSAVLQGFTYNYDVLGNMQSRADNTTSLSETFGYDALDRLASVAGATSKTYEYNSIGNILNKTDVAPSMPGGSYLYQSGKPHAVSAVQGAFNFGYDANGNMNGGAGRTVTLTSFNLPASIQTGSTLYSWAYDANYVRAKLTTPTDTKIYVRDENGLPMYERTVSSGLQISRSMIYAGGEFVAQDTRRSNGQNDFRYAYSDAMGSISLVLNETGQVLERFSYDAFGKRRFPSGQDDAGNTLTASSTSYSFTGHEYMDELKLIHMNGRLYDPFIGRFISADARDGKTDQPQDLNRYSYALQNPLRYFDPTGFGPLDRGSHVAFQNPGQADVGISDRYRIGGSRTDADNAFVWMDQSGRWHYGIEQIVVWPGTNTWSIDQNWSWFAISNYGGAGLSAAAAAHPPRPRAPNPFCNIPGFIGRLVDRSGNSYVSIGLPLPIPVVNRVLSGNLNIDRFGQAWIGFGTGFSGDRASPGFGIARYRGGSSREELNDFMGGTTLNVGNPLGGWDLSISANGIRRADTWQLPGASISWTNPAPLCEAR